MDRLTTLMNRFQLVVQKAPLAQANLVAMSDSLGQPNCLLFCPRHAVECDIAQVLFSAQVDWARAQNPMMTALPDQVEFDLSQSPETAGLVLAMKSEVGGNRCGAQSVVNRLGEVLMVRLLRDQIERGETRTGLLSGLADPRLSRAIVAIHDHPGRAWTKADLAQQAGLSESRFSELFGAMVGETPMSYLRRWRLILAHQDLLRGDRVEMVARRYAYGSPEGFTRAFRKAYGVAPVSLRRAAA